VRVCERRARERGEIMRSREIESVCVRECVRVREMSEREER